MQLLKFGNILLKNKAKLLYYKAAEPVSIDDTCYAVFDYNTETKLVSWKIYKPVGSTQNPTVDIDVTDDAESFTNFHIYDGSGEWAIYPDHIGPTYDGVNPYYIPKNPLDPGIYYFNVTANSKSIAGNSCTTKQQYVVSSVSSFELDESNTYIAIEYIPETTITLTSISTALGIKVTNGRAMYAIWHEDSGVLIDYKEQLNSFTNHDITVLGVNATEVVISDFTDVKLKAGEKYFIYINALSWTSGSTNYHYYYTPDTGKYITSRPSDNSTIYKAFSNYNWVSTPCTSFTEITNLPIHSAVKYTGSSTLQIGSLSFNTNDIIGLDENIPSFIGSFNYLPGGSQGTLPTSEVTVYLTEGYWESAWGYNPAGLYIFRNNTWTSYSLACTKFESHYNVNATDIKSDRKYYLTISGE